MTHPGQSPASTRIVVAMSGGVDSSVVAGKLAAEGYQAVGMTMQLYDHGASADACDPAPTAKSKTCCAGQDIYDARRVADRLGIPHYVVDYEARFERDVIAKFADSYVRGETPIPCVLCNQTVKFRDLVKAAKDLGADALATGHYVRRIDGPHGPELHRGADHDRDQSYFLFATTKDQLAYLRFPLGELSKPQTRALARLYDIAVADKPDSQDICFVPDGDYAAIVRKLRPEAGEGGDIVHVDGRVLGRHDGIVNYTVGQRKGLGVGGFAEPLYVVRVEPDTRRVVVGGKADILRDGFTLHGVNWLGEGDAVPSDGINVMVKLRNTHVPVAATVFGDGADKTAARVVLAQPEAAVSPGQACVFYDGTRVLGGGWITRDANSEFRPHNLRGQDVVARSAAAE
ncbi:MAG: tRNA 2-thiouridine(34) synthase MnmA [Rhodobacteraceae bacterium]|nr:tRNA 2-thiouridine(34) synthase MnmA [Paracoccaceae bacterium]